MSASNSDISAGVFKPYTYTWGVDDLTIFYKIGKVGVDVGGLANGWVRAWCELTAEKVGGIGRNAFACWSRDQAHGTVVSMSSAFFLS